MGYFVIMPDGGRYGPVSADMLAQWTREGWIHPATLIEAEGSNQHIPLSNVPGIILSDRGSAEPTGTPPPFATGHQPMRWSTGPQSTTPYGRGDYDAFGNPKRISALVITTWACLGITFLRVWPLNSLVGVVVGMLALARGDRSAKTPLILNAVLLVCFVLGIWLVPDFVRLFSFWVPNRK